MRVRKRPPPIVAGNSWYSTSRYASGTFVRFNFSVPTKSGLLMNLIPGSGHASILSWIEFCLEMDATNSGTNPSVRNNDKSVLPTSGSIIELTPKSLRYESIQGRTNTGTSMEVA